jgi:hypothetical protein
MPFMGETLKYTWFQLQTPKVDASCLHKSLDVILRLSSYIGYDERLLQLL